MPSEESALEALRSRLAETGCDYLCTPTAEDTIVRVHFLGRFQGRPVAWNATIYTLERYHQEQSPAGAASSQRASARSFFEIAPAADGSCGLKVGLNLPVIDEPAVKKTIIMIRNYKRLRPGRHEWGEAVSLTAG